MSIFRHPEIESALLEFKREVPKNEQIITVQDVINKFSISSATAQRWLNLLIEKRLVDRIGRTRNVRYCRKAQG